MPQIELEIRRFVVENFVFDDSVVLSDTDSFIELGIIDSVGILQLIGFAEEHYGITFADGELIPENLDSVSNMARLIRAKLDRAASAA